MVCCNKLPWQLAVGAIDDRGISPLESMVSTNGGWPLAIIPPNVWNPKNQNFTLQSIYENYIKMGAPAPLFRIGVKRDRENPNVNILSVRYWHLFYINHIILYLSVSTAWVRCIVLRGVKHRECGREICADCDEWGGSTRLEIT